VDTLAPLHSKRQDAFSDTCWQHNGSLLPTKGMSIAHCWLTGNWIKWTPSGKSALYKLEDHQDCSGHQIS